MDTYVPGIIRLLVIRDGASHLDIKGTVPLGPVQTTQKLSEILSRRASCFLITNAVWVETMQKLSEILSETRDLSC